MRGTVRRLGGTALATVVLAAGPAACTDGEQEGARPCTDGTYAWSDVRRSEELTELADPIRLEKRTASSSARLEPVGETRVRPVVNGAPRGVGAADVITALGKHLGVEEPLAGPSERDVPEERLGHVFEAATGDLKGAYYSWGYRKAVEADFAYACGSAAPVRGHVRTWEGTGTGFLPCSAEPAELSSGRQAARQRCPEGSKAVETS
ncbi:hypothetical protein ACH4C6_29105 [Streptomyces sp. NPDC017943]|uniref:hypothetical protein n=1 Tax=Streptomyces sp. NPDC017943 TaxID=3365019 RepID=UPI0037B3651F